jgi:hypothetical protein
MAKRDMDQTTNDPSPDRTDQDDRVRGRADEMEDASSDEDFDDTDDLDEEDADEGEGTL